MKCLTFDLFEVSVFVDGAVRQDLQIRAFVLWLSVTVEAYRTTSKGLFIKNLFEISWIK